MDIELSDIRQYLDEGEEILGLYHLGMDDFVVDGAPVPILRDVSGLAVAIVTNFDVYLRTPFHEGGEDIGFTFREEYYASMNGGLPYGGMDLDQVSDSVQQTRSIILEKGKRIL